MSFGASHVLTIPAKTGPLSPTITEIVDFENGHNFHKYADSANFKGAPRKN